MTVSTEQIDITTKSCIICCHFDNKKRYVVKEMMLGTRHEFEYNRCSRCGCLQIGSVPPNLEEYYPKDRYYSLAHKKRNLISKQACKISFKRTSPLSGILSYLMLIEPNLDAISRINISKAARILDVGSGSGSTLLELKSFGYKDAIGIDPYIDKEIQEPVKILKTKITELKSSNKYDLIMFLHSFEHVSDPLETLQSAYDLLDNHGTILIRTPIVSYAFEKYGGYWFQIDAPRHLFILSEYGLKLITNSAGLEIANSYYDSTYRQFVFSECYRNNLSINEAQSRTTPRKLLITKSYFSSIKKARSLNLQRKGDQAVFYIKKKR